MYFAPSERTWTYRKVNLAMHERGKLAAGSMLPTLELDLATERVTVGVQLCREIRFPEQWRSLARRVCSEYGPVSRCVASAPHQPSGRDAALRIGRERRQK